MSNVTLHPSVSVTILLCVSVLALAYVLSAYITAMAPLALERQKEQFTIDMITGNIPGGPKPPELPKKSPKL